MHLQGWYLLCWEPTHALCLRSCNLSKEAVWCAMQKVKKGLAGVPPYQHQCLHPASHFHCYKKVLLKNALPATMSVCTVRGLQNLLYIFTLSPFYCAHGSINGSPLFCFAHLKERLTETGTGPKSPSELLWLSGDLNS